MTRPRARFQRGVASTLLLAAVALPATLAAHAVIHPQRSAPGAYEKYVLRVPNERPVPTTRVELAFPSAVTVVSFGEVPGWTLQVGRAPDGRVRSAVWTGEIGVERFVEMSFIAVNPRGEARLEWRAVQTYANGEVVSWSGPEGSERPASFTVVGPPDGGGGPAALLVAAAALFLGLVSLGLVLRRHEGPQRAGSATR